MFCHQIKRGWFVLNISVLVCLAATSGRGQDCLEYGEYLRHFSALQLPGQAVDVVRSGNIVYMGAASTGVHVIHLLDPEQPELVTTLSIPGGASAVAVEESYLYIAAGESGLQI